MSDTQTDPLGQLLARPPDLLPALEKAYKDVHAHPELSMQESRKENVIPDEALIKLNVRTFDERERKRVLAAIEGIVNAEAEASGAPQPSEITPLDHYPLNVNDKAASDRVAQAFCAHFSADRVHHTGPAPASEDFGCFGTEWHAPSVFWFVGAPILLFMPKPRPRAS